MLLKISHRTDYRYDALLPYALQRLRLTPKGGPTQVVRNWSLSVAGAGEEVAFSDQFGNDTRLISSFDEADRITIVAAGEVETRDTAGVFGAHSGFAPLWLFQAETTLTQAGQGVSSLAKDLGSGDDLEKLHALMALIRERVTYIIGETGPETTAEQALLQGSGVCQDHSHIFISAARFMGFPARYVSGYLLMDDRVDQVASHAWAEVHVPRLGWVAFDASNGISPDERYVRIAIGRDYRDAMPVSGIRLGAADERLEVRISVEQ